MSSKVFSTTGKGCVWILFEEYSVVHNFSVMKGQIGEQEQYSGKTFVQSVQC